MNCSASWSKISKHLAAAVAGALLFSLPAWCHAVELRSRALRAEFQRLHPCPSTGQPTGACPGYQVDHREALVCGGLDDLTNLRWLSLEEHQAKTRVEVKLCRSHLRRPTP
jgi:hypothetical protein